MDGLARDANRRAVTVFDNLPELLVGEDIIEIRLILASLRGMDEEVLLRQRIGAEGVAFDNVCARCQKLGMNIFYEFRAREHEQLVISLHVFIFQVLKSLAAIIGFA